MSGIKKAYEQELGKSVPKSTVYRMLARHNWRKIVPRPRHPKADIEAQEAFKKLHDSHPGRSSKDRNREFLHPDYVSG